MVSSDARRSAIAADVTALSSHDVKIAVTSPSPSGRSSPVHRATLW